MGSAVDPTPTLSLANLGSNVYICTLLDVWAESEVPPRPGDGGAMDQLSKAKTNICYSSSIASVLYTIVTKLLWIKCATEALKEPHICNWNISTALRIALCQDGVNPLAAALVFANIFGASRECSYTLLLCTCRLFSVDRWSQDKESWALSPYHHPQRRAVEPRSRSTPPPPSQAWHPPSAFSSLARTSSKHITSRSSMRPA